MKTSNHSILRLPAFCALLAAAPAARAQQPASVGGALYAWGDNAHKQLGNGPTNPAYSTRPNPVPGLPGGVTAIAGGAYQGLAIQNGSAYAWGGNTDGQIGNGTSTDAETPVPVQGLSSGVTAIAGGGFHSLAVQNGAAYAWGDNSSGQLGNGTTSNSNVPVPVQGLTSNVTAVSGGVYFSLAVQNGAVYAWGYNPYGQLGNGTNGSSNVPVGVLGLTSGVTAVSAGSSHSVALQNGAVFAWGLNSSGQLGNGTTSNSNVPVPVLSLSTGVTSLAAGYYHNLAVQNGHVFAWGYNNDGQLGNGMSGNVFSSTPFQVDPTDLNNIVAVGTSGFSSYALAADGSLWVWGDNSAGELGLGNTKNYTTPQHLLPPSGYMYTGLSTDMDGYFELATLTAVVPEPSTWALLALGTGALGLALRQRSHTAARA